MITNDLRVFYFAVSLISRIVRVLLIGHINLNRILPRVKVAPLQGLQTGLHCVTTFTTTGRVIVRANCLTMNTEVNVRVVISTRNDITTPIGN